jgi:hypothetical protein
MNATIHTLDTATLQVMAITLQARLPEYSDMPELRDDAAAQLGAILAELDCRAGL